MKIRSCEDCPHFFNYYLGAVECELTRYQVNSGYYDNNLNNLEYQRKRLKKLAKQCPLENWE